MAARKQLSLSWQKARNGYKLERRAAEAVRSEWFSPDDELPPPTPNELTFIVPIDPQRVTFELDDLSNGRAVLTDLANVVRQAPIDLLGVVKEWGLLTSHHEMTVHELLKDVLALDEGMTLAAAGRFQELRRRMLDRGIRGLVQRPARVGDHVIETAPTLRVFVWAVFLRLIVSEAPIGVCEHKKCSRFFIGERGCRRRKCKLHSKASGGKKPRARSADED